MRPLLRSNRLRTEGPFMSSFVLSSCLLLAWPAQQRAGIEPARAFRRGDRGLGREADRRRHRHGPSRRWWRFIEARTRTDRKRWRSAVESGRAACRCRSRARFPPTLDTSNMISFDFGSGVVIGDHGEILTLFHVVRGARRADRSRARTSRNSTPRSSRPTRAATWP